MHRIRLENLPRAARGVTLIELVVAMVLVAIVVAATIYFVYPVRQSVDLTARAELTDIADNALQRIRRDVRLALPNSVRVTTLGPSRFLEFLEVRAAGRYRADGGGASVLPDCDNDDAALGQPANDQLSFDPVADRCFKTIGKLPTPPVVGDFLVLNNYGPGFAGQNAYATAGTLNRSQIATVGTGEAGRDRIGFAPTIFQRALHDSPGKRFYAISGPVSYVCDTAMRTVTRYWGYPIADLQPTSFGAGSSALIAESVSTCDFDYSLNVAPQIGLFTLRLSLEKTLSGAETERVNLYHAVHVSNVP